MRDRYPFCTGPTPDSALLIFAQNIIDENNRTKSAEFYNDTTHLISQKLKKAKLSAKRFFF